VLDPDTPEAAWMDPVVAEVRAVRERLFAEAGYSLERLGEMLRETQATSGHEVITLSPRRPEGERGAAA